MARKEINVFSVSFLDLLSGALAAVIILFVIVPKATQEEVQVVRSLDSLQIQVSQLDSILQRAKNSIPDSIYRQIASQVDRMQETIDTLVSQIDVLQRQLANCNEQHEQQQTQINQLQEEVRTQQQKLQDCQNELRNISFMVASIKWETEKQDIDLWVVDPNNITYNYKQKRGIPTGKGLLSADTKEGPGVEVWEILSPNTGQYKFYVTLYSQNNNNVNPKISGRIFYPQGAKELNSVTLNQIYTGGNVNEMKLLVIVTVKEDGSYEFSNP